jgi:hypothetical protein
MTLSQPAHHRLVDYPVDLVHCAMDPVHGILFRKIIHQINLFRQFCV